MQRDFSILSFFPCLRPQYSAKQFSISPFFFPFPLSLLTHRKQAFSPRYKNQALVGNMYLILTPAVSCKKNRMSEMAAEILVDTKQQLKKNTQRSLQYRFQAIVEREATLKIWITPKKFVFQNGAYLLLCRNACQCRNTSSPFHPTLTCSLSLIDN